MPRGGSRPFAHIHGRPCGPTASRKKHAADDDAVFEHVVVVLIPVDRRALEDELGHLRQRTDSVRLSRLIPPRAPPRPPC
jgi:hypothetical protein